MKRALALCGLLAAVVFAAALAFTLLPRNSSDLPPSAVTVEKTITIPPGEPAASRHSSDQVKRAFERAGLPVKTALRVEQGKVVYPKGGEWVYSSGGKIPDMSLLEPRAGGKFGVYVYSSSTYAAKLVGTSPAIDPVRGLRRTMLRDANVVVIVEPRKRALESRIRRVIRSL